MIGSAGRPGFISKRSFDSRVRQFFGHEGCKVNVFMTWISPSHSFGQREFLGLESLFQTNPTSCLIILSKEMDSEEGLRILSPLIDRGFHVQPVDPDFCFLLKNTPAKKWLREIKTGQKNPGRIPLAQNLSNLLRLAALYKYGGVYFDTDFIFLKDFSLLRNSIGAQSTDLNGHWTRLNNAALFFDAEHPLVYKFMEEFATTFDGDKWGYNGPYLISRVTDRYVRTGEFNLTILPPSAFYPIDWIRVGSLWQRPMDVESAKWVDCKIRQLSGSSYGVHLWNRQSRRLKIEQGSVMERLALDHCIICTKNTSFNFVR